MTNEEIAKYRAPEAHQVGGTGVVNTGRGAVYNKDGGLMHLLSNIRDDDVFDAAQAKAQTQKQARVARKAAKDAS